ncbi:hypothetical protein [Arthrobacter sp. PM3]|uniref:hypothetical protein n=1 Tax=Arthrobacter sp. PM3 TaxID=2017685 RepID=UPI000E1013CC|nr:hypothetical protein [Arthrobacter sp. PM3]AXJ10928.1 hypothetical protein CFN17_15910 [Arthrobacter sp. PM3]
MGRTTPDGSVGSEDSNGTLPQATLVIRVWRERDHPDAFRSRIIEGSSDGDESTTTYARSREEVVAAVNRWLGNLPD